MTLHDRISAVTESPLYYCIASLLCTVIFFSCSNSLTPRYAQGAAQKSADTFLHIHIIEKVSLSRQLIFERSLNNSLHCLILIGLVYGSGSASS